MVEPSKYPPVLGIDDLSALIRKSRAAILADRSRAPHRLPPACVPPGTRQPLWLLDDVLAWLQQYKQQPGTPAPVIASGKPARRGRPTKAEQVEAARLGVSVKHLRKTKPAQ